MRVILIKLNPPIYRVSKGQLKIMRLSLSKTVARNVETYWTDDISDIDQNSDASRVVVQKRNKDWE